MSMKKINLLLMIVIVACLLFSSSQTVLAGPPPGSWASGIACQNLNQTEVANLELNFYQEGNASAVLTYTDSIAAGGSKGWYTPDITNLASAFIGSVVISSNTELSCNVNTTYGGQLGTLASPYRIGTSSGFSDLQTSPTLYAPQVEKNFAGGWNSYIAIQNSSLSDVTVDITYSNRNGAAVPAADESYTIHGQTNKVVYQNDNAGIPDGFLGSAKVTATDGTTKLAAVVNFYNNGSASTSSQFLSYNAMSSGGEKLFVPYLVRNYAGYNGGLSIQNIGTVATSVTITFVFGTHTYTYNSASIPIGSALALYTPDVDVLDPVDALPSNQRAGSATIEADTAGAEIVAIVNQSNFGGPGIPLERIGQGAAYNAVVNGTQANNVFLPQIPRRAGGIFSGGFQITNTTNVAGTCTLTYAGVAAATETDVPLPANGVISRYGPSVTNLPDGFNKGVTVECTQPVVAIANLAADPGTGKVGDSFTQSNAINTP